jgi:hypothetical protein
MRKTKVLTMFILLISVFALLTLAGCNGEIAIKPADLEKKKAENTAATSTEITPAPIDETANNAAAPENEGNDAEEATEEPPVDNPDTKQNDPATEPTPNPPPDPDPNPTPNPNPDQNNAGQGAETDTAKKFADLKITLIGDSVVLGGVDAMKEALPGIDIRAKNSRKLSGQGLDTLKQEKKDGKLGDIVILALGTNNITKDDITKAMDVIGKEKQVVFVNAYRGGSDYIKDVNAAIDSAADKYSNFTIADWYGHVSSNKDIKLAADQCHLTSSSAKDYAEVVKAAAKKAAAKMGVK